MTEPVYLEVSTKPKSYEPAAPFFRVTAKSFCLRVFLTVSKKVVCWSGWTVLMLLKARPRRPSLSTSWVN